MRRRNSLCTSLDAVCVSVHRYSSRFECTREYIMWWCWMWTSSCTVTVRWQSVRQSDHKMIWVYLTWSGQSCVHSFANKELSFPDKCLSDSEECTWCTIKVQVHFGICSLSVFHVSVWCFVLFCVLLCCVMLNNNNDLLYIPFLGKIDVVDDLNEVWSILT